MLSLSGNKGLCGVPSLPACPVFWENGKLSTQGKVAIGLSCLFVSCVILLLVYIYIRKRRNDYDFALPHELTCKYDFIKIFFCQALFFRPTGTALITLLVWFLLFSVTQEILFILQPNGFYYKQYIFMTVF